MAVADGAIPFVFPDEGSGALEGLATECGTQAGAFHGLDCLTGEMGGVRGAGEVHAGGHDVDQLAGLRFESALAVGGDASRPVGDQRRGNAAFVGPMLVLAEWSATDIRPTAPVGDIGVGSARKDPDALAHGVTVAGLFRLTAVLGIVGRHRGKCGLGSAGGGFVAATISLGTAAVVLEIEDEGVVELPVRLQFSDDPADALIHGVELGGVDFHATAFKGLVGNLVPGFGRGHR